MTMLVLVCSTGAPCHLGCIHQGISEMKMKLASWHVQLVRSVRKMKQPASMHACMSFYTSAVKMFVNRDAHHGVM